MKHEKFTERCRECGQYNLSVNELTDGLCPDCYDSFFDDDEDDWDDDWLYENDDDDDLF